MNCPQCDKIIPITKAIQATGDAVQCIYCHAVVPSEKLTWTDGEFHFNIMGDVTVMPIAPQILLRNQSTKILDINAILARAKKIIKSEPNIYCLVREFDIREIDYRLELLKEPK